MIATSSLTCVASTHAQIAAITGTSRAACCARAYLLQGAGIVGDQRNRCARWRLSTTRARKADGTPLVLRPRRRRIFASEHLNNDTRTSSRRYSGSAIDTSWSTPSYIEADRGVPQGTRGTYAACTARTRCAPDYRGMALVRAELQPQRHGHPRLRAARRRSLLPRAGLPRLHPRPAKKSATPIFRRMLISHRRASPTVAATASQTANSPPASSRSPASKERSATPRNSPTTSPPRSKERQHDHRRPTTGPALTHPPMEMTPYGQHPCATGL